MVQKVERASSTKMGVVFEPVTLETMNTYIEVGTQSYKEHYLHLWENQIPTYLTTSFTKKVVQKELSNPNCRNYLVKSQYKNAGIIKITVDQAWGEWNSGEALYLHRIYLLKNTTGKNIGTTTLNFVENLAMKQKKKIIWLEAMKKGNAKEFYHKNGFEVIGDAEITLPGVLQEEKEMWVMGKRL